MAGSTERLGRYEILRTLAVGGMGEVYLARRRGAASFSRQVVLKRTHAKFLQDPFTEQQLEEEAWILGLVAGHDNIARLEDLERTEDGRLFMVMEYVDGSSLASLQPISRTERPAEESPLPVWLGLHVASEILEALIYLHGLETPDGERLEPVHRDVSPSNILVSRLGQVKLTDFGLARFAGRQARTAAGQLKGTFGYMSPEMVRGHVIDQRSDLFSLGVVLWELLTHRPLFWSVDELATLTAIIEGERPPPSRFRAGLPPSIDALVLRALELDPSARYPDAEHFQAEVLRALSSLRPPVRQRDVRELLQSRMGASPATRADASSRRGATRSAEEDTTLPTHQGQEAVTLREAGLALAVPEGASFQLRSAGRSVQLGSWRALAEALGRDGSPGLEAEISTDGAAWISRSKLEALLDHAFGPTLPTQPRLLEMGSFPHTAIGVLARLQASARSGLLAVEWSDGSWAEIAILRGAPLGVRCSEASLQLPRRLAALAALPEPKLEALVHRAVGAGRRLEDLAAEEGLAALDRRALAVERLAPLLERPRGEFTFAATEPVAEAGPSVAPSLLAPLPSLLGRVWPLARLEATLGPSIETPLEFTDALLLLDHASLSPQQRTALDALRSARTLKDALATRADRQATLGLAYLLLEAARGLVKSR